jgi:hypothetical protein
VSAAEAVPVAVVASVAVAAPVVVNTVAAHKEVAMPVASFEERLIAFQVPPATLRVVAESRKQVVVAGEQEAHVALVAMGVAQLMLSSQMQARRAVH